MSRPIFTEVCSSCFDPFFDKIYKKGLEKTAKANDHLVCKMLSREFLLNDQMHRECLLAAVRDPHFIFSLEWEWADLVHIFAMDLELVHAFCQGHPKPDDLIASLVSSGHLSIDVYRYLEQNFNVWVEEFGTSEELFVNGVYEGNFDLVQYVAPKMKEFDDLVGQLCWQQNGAKGLEILNCYTDVKPELIETINAMGPEEIEEPEFKVNIQELLAKNFICGSQICHKI